MFRHKYRVPSPSLPRRFTARRPTSRPLSPHLQRPLLNLPRPLHLLKAMHQFLHTPTTASPSIRYLYWRRSYRWRRHRAQFYQPLGHLRERRNTTGDRRMLQMHQVLWMRRPGQRFRLRGDHRAARFLHHLWRGKRQAWAGRFARLLRWRLLLERREIREEESLHAAAHRGCWRRNLWRRRFVFGRGGPSGVRLAQ